ncbi:MAG: hypothetical protein KDB75_12130, partial [Flavobacteriales bacterium]|nr:hypothetical protein [Flavobacteriales bacterium]
SEEFIARSFRDGAGVKARYGDRPVEWMKPFTGLCYDLGTGERSGFDLRSDAPGLSLAKAEAFAIVDHSKGKAKASAPAAAIGDEGRLRNLVEFPEEVMRTIKRCTKCLLPETFPYINYDGAGVCNYCHSYKPKGLTVDKRPAFEEVLKQYRRNDGKQDCIVAFSGGRDSSYGLHLLVKEFGMTPLTFTYDWGLVT